MTNNCKAECNNRYSSQKAEDCKNRLDYFPTIKEYYPNKIYQKKQDCDSDNIPFKCKNKDIKL